MKKYQISSGTDWIQKINFQGHFLVGETWEVKGSKDNTYEVEMYKNGLVCSCPGFLFHGSCKHVQKIAKRIVLS